tara:strand:- start:1652 stop:2299 length:648 start_codon:yes stop_codon:yes gene_type:complete
MVIFGSCWRRAVEGWQNVVESMDSEHRHMLRGGSVSNFFLRDSLTLSHPVFVGGIYGLMISIALLPSMMYGGLFIGEGYSQIGRYWLIRMLVIVAITSILGAFSILISTIVKRPPARLLYIRKILFALPFIGLTILTASFIDNQYGIILDRLGWFIYILPGPLWIHLSYAPRWRIIDRIDRGIEPFDGMKKTVYGNTKTVRPESDFDLEEVIDII